MKSGAHHPSPPAGGEARAPTLVAGIGFRHAATADDIVALIRGALAGSGASADDLGAIATAADRADDAAIRDAARVFGLVPTPVSSESLRAVDSRVPTRSARIEASRGVGSVAEAAALALAGPGGTLVLARIAGASATCALALPAQSATHTP